MLVLTPPPFGGIKFKAPLPEKSEIAKMGYEEFNDWALEHLADNGYSEATADQIAIGYADIKTEANREAATQIPDKISEKIFLAGGQVDEWQTGRLGTMYIYHGGDTRYVHALARDHAYLMDTVGHAIDKWQTPGQPANFLDVDALAFRGADKPGTEISATEWQEQLAMERAFLAEAIGATAKLPSGPRQIIGQYIANEAKAWNGCPRY